MYTGGIRTPSISRADSEEKEMRRPDDRKHLLRHFVSNLIYIYILYIFILSIKVGFERQAFPERIARKKKCAGRTIGNTFSAILFRILYKIIFCIYFCNVYMWDSLRRLLLSIELRKARSLEQQVALDLQANRASLTVALLG